MFDTQVNGVASLCGVFLFLTTGSVVLRFAARFKQQMRPWVDDYLALVAWIGFVGMASLLIFGMTRKFIGFPEPADMAFVDAVHPTMELTYLSLAELEVFTFAIAKLSLLFFYRRIFCTVIKRDAFYWVTLGLIVIVTAQMVTFMVMTWNLCGSRSLHWAIQPGHFGFCKLDYPYYEASTIVDFILDFLVLTPAFVKIWSLRMPREQKVAATFVCVLALGGLGASCARMVVYVHFIRTGRTINDQDSFQTNTQVGYYAVLEGGVTCVCINLPSIWYFVGGASPQTILRSFRSLGSLGSRLVSKNNDSSSAASSTRNASSGGLRTFVESKTSSRAATTTMTTTTITSTVHDWSDSEAGLQEIHSEEDNREAVGREKGADELRPGGW